MNDGMLSEDEINALLNGNVVSDNATTSDSISFSTMEQDALGEIGNISMGSSTTALSMLLNQKVEITTPTVTVVSRNELIEQFPKPYVIVQVQYTEGLVGSNLLVINTHDASIIANLMLGGNGEITEDYLDEISLSAVQEAMNQMAGMSATSMSTMFGKRVDISPPMIDVLDFVAGTGTEKIPLGDLLVKVSFNMKIGHLIDSTIMQLLPVDFAKDVVSHLLNPTPQEAAPTNKSAPKEEKKKEEPKAKDTYAQASPQPVERPMEKPKPSSFQPTNVQPAIFTNFQPMKFTEIEAKNLDILFDIPLKVTVELGRTSRSVKDILELSSGSIIELDKLAGEPVDILINNKLMAKGEVVVIDENFGVRITDIVSKIDRVNKLR